MRFGIALNVLYECIDVLRPLRIFQLRQTGAGLVQQAGSQTICKKGEKSVCRVLYW